MQFVSNAKYLSIHVTNLKYYILLRYSITTKNINTHNYLVHLYLLSKLKTYVLQCCSDVIMFKHMPTHRKWPCLSASVFFFSSQELSQLVWISCFLVHSWNMDIQLNNRELKKKINQHQGIKKQTNTLKIKDKLDVAS